MSLGWRRNGEEIEELTTGPCSTMQLLRHPQGAEVARDHLTDCLGNANSFSTRLYHMGPSPPQHPMTALQKHLASVSPCSYASGNTPPLPCHHSCLWPSTAPQASLGSHQCWEPAGNGALELLAESPREQVCTFWQAWRSISGYPF